MGTTQVVFLGRPGLEFRFAIAAMQGNLPDHDYYTPIFTLNRKGELEELARKEGYDLFQRDTLEFIQGLPAEERWEAARRRIYKFLAEDCMFMLDLLQNTKHTPVNLDDNEPLPEWLTARSGIGAVPAIRAIHLIDRALENAVAKEGVSQRNIWLAQDLSNCLLHMTDCFCTLYPGDYTVSGYVLPGEHVTVREEDAVMLFVDIHR